MTERPLSAISSDTLARAANVPLPQNDTESIASLPEPRAPYIAENAVESPRLSVLQATPNGSGMLLGKKESSVLQPTPNDSGMLLANKESFGEEPVATPPNKDKESKRRPLLLALLALGLLAIVVIAIVIPVYFTVIKPKKNTSSSPAGSGSTGGAQPTSTGTAGPGNAPPPTGTEALFGGDGSTVKATNGSTFIYNNKLGGIWYYDANEPYNNNAYPNSWTRPLNQSWNFGTDRIYGVNLGGWFVLEPFISPAIFQKYPGAVDEWTLSQLMAADTANGGLAQLEEHYKTFITEDDFAEIASAGLNWIRLPVPFWAIDKWGNEPFLEKTCWKYIVQALQWSRKYGLRVKLDLHTIPGSQSGYNHSGKGGQINFLMGTMGMANAQRAMNYMRIFTEFISQPEWRDVVPIFGIMNEARISDIGVEQLRGFYVEAYKMIRGITGIGEGKGPYISIHDGFQTFVPWAGFLTGADRMIIDTHPYFAFSGQPATDPLDTGVGPTAGGIWPAAACDRWSGNANRSRTAFGISVAGEWSNGFSDCGLFLTGVNGNQAYGGNCADWEDSSNWTEGTKAGLLRFASASMDALEDWFFWTWKIGPSSTGVVGSPLWSYQLGLRQGWMPTDPRSALGTCGPPSGPIFDGVYQPWMTGGAGAGDIGAAQTAQYPYPPASLSSAAVPVAQLPVYTSTGTIATLPAPTYTNLGGSPVAAGNGWFNANDNEPAPTTISGCTYPDPWDAQNVAAPIGCAGGLVAPAAITPPPARR